MFLQAKCASLLKLQEKRVMGNFFYTPVTGNNVHSDGKDISQD